MKTIRLGCTDIGAILFAGLDDDNHLCSTYISVGGDGEFTGLLTTNKAEIPPNYDHMLTRRYWLKIYDDNSLVLNKYATTIEVYQNANLNIIILVNE